VQSENGLLVDVGQVREVVETADVFVIGFSNLPERLLIDTRASTLFGPMIKVVEPLGSIQERLFWLAQERGSFGMPQSFTFFAWPHSIGYLEESGIWARVLDRVRPNADAERKCAAAFATLRTLEREAMLAAIKGDRFVTIWPADPSDAG
jgi:hypothetical protein